MIYEADCHTLKTNQKTDIKIDDYFLWKERSLFDFQVSFQGQSITTVRYGYVNEETITQSATYNFISADVINDDRENKFPVANTDGTYKIEKSDSFNPPGAYGKIKDSDLIKIRHNPCFDCSFTAWVTLRRNQTNRLALVDEPIDDPVPPGKPNDSYDRWDIVRGPELWAVDDSGRETYAYLVNSSQRITRTSSIQIGPGYIDPKTRNVGGVFSFSGWAQESPDSSNAKIKVGTHEYDGFIMGLEDGITAQIEWRIKARRDL
jgi:hypothetical protein